jgi:acetyl-CoA carboxylase biotin carboxyl carrier protein
MNETQKRILDILEMFDRSEFSSLNVEFGDVKISASKAGSGVAPVMREIAGGGAGPVPETAPDSDAPPAQPGDDIPPGMGMVAVRAPVMGMFYLCPAPDEKPFVEVGDHVGPDDTVCLLECMKLFSSVSAGVAGRVAAFLVENEAMVELDQPIMLIEPE